MTEKLEFDGGIYEGETQNGVPHGEGTWTLDDDHYYRGSWVNGKKQGQGYLRLDEDSRYEGEFQNGVPEGMGLYGHVCRRDMDGIDVRIVRYARGEFKDGLLSGVVWQYFLDEDLDTRVEEYCVIKDASGLQVFGVDRKGKFIGRLAGELEELSAADRDGVRIVWDVINRSGWGQIRRDGKVFVGQIATDTDNPYFGYEFYPHGFCAELVEGRCVYVGSFYKGERRGLGAVFNETEDENGYLMTFGRWE